VFHRVIDGFMAQTGDVKFGNSESGDFDLRRAGMGVETIILVVFVLGYLAIAFEHTLKLDKLIPALIMMAVMWGLISYFDLTVFEIDTKNKELIPEKLKYVLNYFLGHTAEILVFLIGAMTIVETIDFF